MPTPFFSEDKTLIHLPQEKDVPELPFHQHPQFPALVNTLIRKHSHHILLSAEFAGSFYPAFLKAFLVHLREAHIAWQWRKAQLYFFDFDTLPKTPAASQLISNTIIELQHKLENNNEHYIFTLRSSTPDSLLKQQLMMLADHPRCRLVLLHPENVDISIFSNAFSRLELRPPTQQDTLSLLKQQRTELEDFHYVLIPDEILSEALALANRFLNSNKIIENTLLLLDSSAARAGSHEHPDHHNPFKPVLTQTVLYQVLSDWTGISASYLSTDKFSASEFLQSLQQRIFGQDIAVNLLSQGLQQAYARLRHHGGPFASFLLAAPQYTGKKTTAISLSQQLFGSLEPLFIYQFSSFSSALIDAQCQRQSDLHYFSLKHIIREKPYAVLFFENIEQAPQSTLAELAQILCTGYLHDKNSQRHDFRQCIIMLATQSGAEALTKIATPQKTDETPQLDIMQLIMTSERKLDHSAQDYTTDELIQAAMPSLNNTLPNVFFQHTVVLPFLPVDKAGIEKIIRIKLKTLAQDIENHYGSDLAYAPEVIPFLAKEAFNTETGKHQKNNIEQALKQLYLSIERTLLQQKGLPNQPAQLFLQLNETGQVLHCHCLTLPLTRQHTQ